MKNSYEDRQQRQPIEAVILFSGESIAVMQRPYLLSEADFLRLQSSSPGFFAFGTMIFSAVMGYVVSFGPKFIQYLQGKAWPLAYGENWTVIIGVALSLGCCAAAWIWSSEKTKMMKKIRRHFANAQQTTYIIGGSR